MRALIIGGGIGGVTAAIALRQAGIDAAVFERAPEPREVGAGISLWSNAVRALDRLGAADGVIGTGGEIRIGELRAASGRLLVAMNADRMSADLGPSLMLHRAELLAALLACLPPGVVTFGAECTGIAHDASEAAATFAGRGGGRRERGDILIGADGVNSVVRAAIHGDRPARYSGYTCWRAVASIPAGVVEPGRVCEYCGRGARFGIAPIDDDRVYWYATLNAPPDGRDGDVKAELGALFGGWARPIPEVLAFTPGAAVIRGDIIDRPPLARSCPWGAGRITLLGDAAHPTTPNLGQGAAMAIEDAVVLARWLGKSGNEPVAALRAYERRRHARTAMITNKSFRLGAMAQWSSPAACRLRDNLVGATPSWLMARGHRQTIGYDA